MDKNDDGSPRGAGGKDTNPKDAVGTKKWRQIMCIPFAVLWEVGVGMLEGARKYGRHNYRVSKVRASVYVEAAMAGHLMPWWEGEDIDEESGLNHITKAICSLVVLRDAMITGQWVDDRPPKIDMGVMREKMQGAVDSIFERHPVAVAAYLEGDQRTENWVKSIVIEPDVKLRARALSLWRSGSAIADTETVLFEHLTHDTQKYYLEKARDEIHSEDRSTDS